MLPAAVEEIVNAYLQAIDSEAPGLGRSISEVTPAGSGYPVHSSIRARGSSVIRSRS
jgi:hypothetical protein